MYVMSTGCAAAGYEHHTSAAKLTATAGRVMESLPRMMPDPKRDGAVNR
jgi:hypothetical protein